LRLGCSGVHAATRRDDWQQLRPESGQLA
jgi:hypothetical protein